MSDNSFDISSILDKFEKLGEIRSKLSDMDNELPDELDNKLGGIFG